MNTQNDKAVMAIREQAAGWVIRLGTPDVSPESSAEFAAWMRTSPIHVREYLRAEATWLAVRGVAQTNRTDITGLLREAQTNIVELPQERKLAPGGEAIATPRRRRALPLAMAATALLVIGAALALVLTHTFDRNTYSTSVGEMRRVVLDDGSAVELNTRSKIRVAFTEAGRDIHLESGEAYFSVARDSRRPFRVHSDTTVIRALGTEFSVYRKSGRTIVTVVEGKVAATKAGQDEVHAGVELTAGRQVVVETAAVPAPANVDAVRATAWRQRRLIFHHEPLGEVVAEFNRYNRRQLVVEDEDLAARDISGVFDPEKPEGLIGFLTRGGEVRAVESGSGIIVLDLLP
jgi:transmembrane sensor